MDKDCYFNKTGVIVKFRNAFYLSFLGFFEDDFCLT